MCVFGSSRSRTSERAEQLIKGDDIPATRPYIALDTREFGTSSGPDPGRSLRNLATGDARADLRRGKCGVQTRVRSPKGRSASCLSPETSGGLERAISATVDK